MSTLRAADLPVGSVVADKTESFIKIEVDVTGEWYKTCSDDLWWDSEVQACLNAGAKVLRVGDGSNQ